MALRCLKRFWKQLFVIAVPLILLPLPLLIATKVFFVCLLFLIDVLLLFCLFWSVLFVDLARFVFFVQVGSSACPFFRRLGEHLSTKLLLCLCEKMSAHSCLPWMSAWMCQHFCCPECVFRLVFPFCLHLIVDLSTSRLHMGSLISC